MANHVQRHRPAILLVEKDEALRSALAFALEMEGFSVTGYADVETALAASRAGFSCLVIDHTQPGMSWREFLDLMRARGEAAPAVLIASHPSRATSLEAREASVEIVQKPLIGTELSDAVHRAVGV